MGGVKAGRGAEEIFHRFSPRKLEVRITAAACSIGCEIPRDGTAAKLVRITNKIERSESLGPLKGRVR
jgi:hypothetical protein